MASRLHAAGLDVTPAVGAGAAAEFKAYLSLYRDLPDLERILAGAGAAVPFPDEPSVRYATTLGLTSRAEDAQAAYHAFRWLADVAPLEWVQLCAADLFRLMRARGQMPALAALIAGDARLQKYLDEYQQILAAAEGQAAQADAFLRAARAAGLAGQPGSVTRHAA
jgi:hypothetical protein